MGHGSGIPSSGLRKACLCLSVTKTAFFGRFLRFLRFPFSILSDAFFVQNPSGFVLFSPFLFTIRALFVVRSPQSSPEAPQSPATCPDHPLRCAGVRAPSPKHLSPPAVSARLRSKRCLDELGLHGPCGLPPLSGWQGGGRTDPVKTKGFFRRRTTLSKLLVCALTRATQRRRRRLGGCGAAVARTPTR